MSLRKLFFKIIMFIPVFGFLSVLVHLFIMKKIEPTEKLIEYMHDAFWFAMKEDVIYFLTMYIQSVGSVITVLWFIKNVA